MTKYRQIGTTYGIVTFDNAYHRTDGVIRDAVPNGVQILSINEHGCVINPETFVACRQYILNVGLTDDADVLWQSPG